MGGSENLAEALVLAEVVGAIAAIVEARNHDWPAVGESEFVAVERRNTAGLGDGAAVEEIAGVEGGVTNEFEHAAVEVVDAGLGDDFGIARRSVSDFGGQHARSSI